MDHMTNTDIEFKEYLAANGYDVTQMGLPGFQSVDVEKDLAQTEVVPASVDEEGPEKKQAV